MRVLVVEDDPLLQKLLYRGLTSDGQIVVVVGSGEAALECLHGDIFDVLVLDLTLPDRDGLEVARQLRGAGNSIPILMLTARDDLTDRLAGFAAGTDDYVIKPFALQELLARLRALGRRGPGRPDEDRLVLADLVLDRRAHEVRRAGRLIHLAPKEDAVLELLMSHVGQAFSRAAIMEHVWSYSFEGNSNVVETSIRRLRLAIDRGFEPALIQTVHGFGYKMQAP